MQGFTVDEYFVYQENLIVVILEKNGRKSIFQRTKHIQVRYYFIKHCITDDMGRYRFPDQVHDDVQILGKYPIRVRFRFRFRVRVRDRVRVQLPTEQPHELRIIIN